MKSNVLKYRRIPEETLRRMADAEEHYSVSAGGARPAGVSGDPTLNSEEMAALSVAITSQPQCSSSPILMTST
ncbi:MAG: hypothetical protein ACLQVD_18840 [Capsulimonadaceae bacterium]